MKKLLLALALVIPALTFAQDGLPPPFPRQNATKLLETERIAVWDISWPRKQPTALHRHVYDQVGTYYARGGRVITTPDGNVRKTMTEVGSLSTTRKGTTHVEEGDSDPPLRAVFIELKQDRPSGTPRGTAGNEAFAPAGGKEAFNDERVLVTEYIERAGDPATAYRTACDTVIVYLGEGRLKVAIDGADAKDLRVSPGTMRYLPRGTRVHEAVTDGAPRAMAFEIK